MKSRVGVGVSVLVVAWCLFVPRSGHLGADQVMDPEMRAKNATDIVVGSVSEVYSKEVDTEKYGKGTMVEKLLVEIQIATVEKGVLTVGDVLYVRAFKLLAYPPDREDVLLGARWGHNPIPRVGQRVRAYVKRGPYGPTGQTDNGYSALYECGFEILPDKEKSK